MRKNLLSLIVLLILPLSVFANEKINLMGNVIDADTNEPLIGVSVAIEGTTVGIMTDLDGNFKLSVPADSEELTFSYIGYTTQKVAIGSQRNFNIKLKPESQVLEEMVVVGYAVQKKANLTGAVSSVDMDDIVSRPSFNTESLLQGQVAGVNIVNAGAQPGGDATIRIRGVGTIGSGEKPLVLIDGVEGTLSDVAPTDIETISVLKDAASCAIYGARAANGVVLVKTRTGGQGNNNKVSYSGSFSIQEATVLPELLNGYEYATLMNEAYINGKKPRPFSDEVLERILNQSTPDMLSNTYWPGELFHSAPMTQHNVSITGSRERLKYMMSVGYQYQDGIMKGTNADRLQFRMNLSSDIFNWLTVGANVSGLQKNITAPNQGTTGSDGLMNDICFASPLCPVKYSDGRYATAIDEATGMPYINNPLYQSEISKDTRFNNINSKLFADISILDNLKLSTNVSYYLIDKRTKAFTPQITHYDYTGTVATTTVAHSTLSKSYVQNSQLNTETTLNWNEKFANKHNVNVLLGYSYLHYGTVEENASIQDFADNSITVPDAGSSNAKFSGTESAYTLQSVFGRLNYNFDERYLFEANFRYDGSSRFAPGHRYGLFPSFSGAWRVSEEKFFKNWNQRVLDNLKIRASWGKLGNQDVGYYPYQQTLGFGNYVSGDGVTIPGLVITDYANSDITWETTTITNVGIDFGLFSNRLTGTFELFNKITDDILLQLPIPDIMGDVTAPYENAGVVRNRGWEFALNYSDRIGKVDFSIGGNVSQIENKIIDLKGHTFYPSDMTIHAEGYQVGAFYGYVTDGVFRPMMMPTKPDGTPWPDGPQMMSAQQIIDYYAAKQAGAQPGDFRYVNLYDTPEELAASGNLGVINSKDRKVIGNPFPEFEYSFNASVAWNGIDASVLFQGVGNVDVYTLGAANQPGANDRMNMTTEWLNRTIPSQDIWTDYPRLAVANTMNTRPSDFWVEDASYLRMKNIEIGYDLTKHLVKSDHVSSMRIFISGQNLLTFTGIKNWDPERVSGANGNAAYPQAKSYTIGLTAKF